LETNRIPTATRWYSENVANGTERFLVSAQFNLQKVGLHQLVPEGSSFQVVTHDLVTADRIDFHPVEILQEPDGNLLLFDTGGWYDLCCPSSGSDQSIAHGGVYRLKPKALSTASSEDAPIKSDPAELEQEVSWLRKQYLWAIARDITEDAAQPDKMHRILAMLEDPDATIQQTAARIVGLHRWRNATRQLESLLNSKSAPTVRTAIESLGVVGDRTSVGPIVKAASRFSEDRMVQHSAIYAILEIGAESELVEMASHSESDVERYLAIYALDQLQQTPDKLFPSLVINLRSNNSDLRQLSLQCLAKQPNGISLCIPFLETAWERREDELLSAALLVVRQGLTSKQIQTQVATWLRKAWTHSPVQQEWLVACLKQAEGQTVPQTWCPPLIDWVRNGSDESLLALAGAIRSADFPPDFRAELASVIRERSELTKSNPELALTLLAASPAQSAPISEKSASLIKEHLSAPESRLATIAEAALARSMLTREGAVAFSPILDELPSVYLQTTLDALLRSGDSELDSFLLTKLASLPAVKSLDGDRVVAGLGNRSDTIKKKWREVFSEATKPPTDVAKSLDQWLEKLPAGDPARGYQVFRSAKAACATCHQVGYIGGNLGPELSKIGKSRTRRDLVESIVFPSQRIAQGFQPVRIRTVDGEVFNGLLSKQTDKYIELLCGADKLCRIDKASIEQQMESKVSVMPMGLDQQISLDEFADLIAYLESRQ
jgi:putative heme-binding domain-containing protein